MSAEKSERVNNLWRTMKADMPALIGTGILIGFVLIALFAPMIATHDPIKMNYTETGQLKSSLPPNRSHWLGTTSMGRDVFSQLIYGTRISLFLGFVAGVIAVIVGASVGMVAGYYGGVPDSVLMRLTDIVYSMPFLPFVVVVVSILGENIWNVLLAIILIIWRTTARVIRSEVLSLRERAFITSARVRGASDLRILLVHITPNLLPLIMLYAVFSMSWAILTAASINFLGFGDPDIISWGGMLFDVYVATAMRKAWWWFFPPGIALAALVVSLFLVSRYFEEIANPRLGKY